MVHLEYSQDLRTCSTERDPQHFLLKEIIPAQQEKQTCEQSTGPFADVEINAPVSLLFTEDSDSVSSSDSLCRTVTWASEIVQEIRYIPKTSCTSEKMILFYNSADYSRFRQNYKEFLFKNAIESRRRDREEKWRKEEQSSYETISWVVNKVHNYLYSQNCWCTGITPAKTKSDVHLDMLVDTLYLF
eukprot:scaffold3215_cov248-Chaetoceros_neogracile.AAC.1